ncbi:MAG: hypothetical protein H6644_23155 [Caldilineaceae bacterium]|nr:hypothetical protein [Caldilineaceae bacterium]
MNAAPPGGPSRLPLFKSIAAQFESADGEPVAGVRIVEPDAGTRQAVRGSLYAVVDLKGDYPERVRLTESLLSVIQRTYYGEKGSQSHVLTESVRAARRKIDEVNHRYPDQPVQAGIICAGFLNGRLMVIHNGPAVALVTTGNRVERYPSNLQTTDAGLPDRPANWEIYRQEVEQGVALFVGTSRWLDAVSIRTLAGTVAHLTIENCRAARTGLSVEAGGADLPGLLFVAERATPRAGGATLRGTPLTAPRRPRPIDAVSLPTALGASPPVRSIPPAATSLPVTRTPQERAGRDPSTSEPSRTAPEQASAPPSHETVEHAGDAYQGPVDDGYGMGPEAESAGDGYVATGDSVTPPPGSAERWRALAASMAASTTGAYDRAKEVMVGMLPDRSAASTANPYAYQPPPQEVEVAPVPQRSFWSDVNERVQEAVSDVEPYAPPAPSTGGRARMFVLLALLIFLLAPIVAYGFFMWNRESPPEEVESLVAMAETRYNNGQLALTGGDEDTARAMCLDADSLLQQAVVIAGRTEPIRALSDDIQRCINATMRTRYLYELTEPLVRFPADAEPHRVLVVDENIFVMDTGRQLVELYRLDGTRSYVPDQMPEVVLREGQTLDGVTVGRLVDIAWQPVIAGYQEKASLLTLDRNNQLFLYDPRVEGAGSVPQAAQSPLRVPNQVEIYLGRTYISDEGANQIFRYEPGQLSSTPEPWFDEQAKANLSGVVRMAIDGDIWLLYNRGSLVRYQSGAQIPFSLDAGAITPDQPVDMAIGDEVAPYIYIADANHERILVFDKEGAYQYQLLAPEENPLRDLRGIFVEPVAGNLYILTKEALYQHPMPN